MKRISRSLRFPPSLPWYALGMLLALASCAGGAGSYTGRPANPESLTPLMRGDIRQLEWQTNDLIIQASYALENGQLNLAGQVRLQQRLAHYPVVDYLSVSVHALNGAGIILASYPLWRSASRQEQFFVNWSFQQRYPVPAETQAVAFSYRGRMRDGGGRGFPRHRDDDAVTWDFWHTP